MMKYPQHRSPGPRAVFIQGEASASYSLKSQYKQCLMRDILEVYEAEHAHKMTMEWQTSTSSRSGQTESCALCHSHLLHHNPQTQDKGVQANQEVSFPGGLEGSRMVALRVELACLGQVMLEDCSEVAKILEPQQYKTNVIRKYSSQDYTESCCNLTEFNPFSFSSFRRGQKSCL